ncbi:MAG: DsbA family protein [Candidatus Kerfeldbacteria bacterium]|nr:DsbA family protein [Candidatus Kerfeldbacteria bacterium]
MTDNSIPTTPSSALSKKEQREEEKKQRDQQRKIEERKIMMKKVVFAFVLIGIVVGIVVVVAYARKTVDDRINVSADPSKGPAEAPVVLKEYSDFQCPTCAAVYPVVKDLLKAYGDKVRFEYNDFPLSQHKYAVPAAIAGQCAFDQNKFFELHDVIFDKQKQWEAASTKDEAQNLFSQYAEGVGLDMTAFGSCVTSQTIADRVNEDMAEGRALSVGGTPTFFVNGAPVAEPPYSVNLKKAIDDALNATATQ